MRALFWLLAIPALLFLGYSVEAARTARTGSSQLPPWERLERKLGDGALVGFTLLVWTLPNSVAALVAPARLPTPGPGLRCGSSQRLNRRRSFNPAALSNNLSLVIDLIGTAP